MPQEDSKAPIMAPMTLADADLRAMSEVEMQSLHLQIATFGVDMREMRANCAARLAEFEAILKSIEKCQAQIVNEGRRRLASERAAANLQ